MHFSDTFMRLILVNAHSYNVKFVKVLSHLLHVRNS